MVIASAEENPSVGICIVLSTNILNDKDNEAPKMITDTVNGKFSSNRFTIDKQVSLTDFKNYLGKKDILLGDVPTMMRELKLPVFAGYGAEKQLDYLVVFFSNASFQKATESSINAYKDKSGHTTVNSYNTTLIKQVELASRVVVVDVKKQEYVYNVMINKNMVDHSGFHTEVRAVRAVVKEYIKDFDQQINLDSLAVAK